MDGKTCRVTQTETPDTKEREREKSNRTGANFAYEATPLSGARSVARLAQHGAGRSVLLQPIRSMWYKGRAMGRRTTEKLSVPVYDESGNR